MNSASLVGRMFIIFPNTLLLPYKMGISTRISQISISLFVCFLACEDFGLALVDFKTMRFRAFLKTLIMFELFQRLAIVGASPAESWCGVRSLCFVLFFRFSVFASWWAEMAIALFCGPPKCSTRSDVLGPRLPHVDKN